MQSLLCITFGFSLRPVVLFAQYGVNDARIPEAACIHAVFVCCATRTTCVCVGRPIIRRVAQTAEAAFIGPLLQGNSCISSGRIQTVTRNQAPESPTCVAVHATRMTGTRDATLGSFALGRNISS
jgi:hypothetical protein